MAFASLSRTLGYIQDAKLRKNRLYIQSTGAEINLNWLFVRDFASAFKLYAHIVGRTLVNRARGQKPVGKICFYPQQPAPWYTIWSVTQFFGLDFTQDPEQADFIFIFDDKTFTNAVQTLPKGFTGEVINARCANISKQNVATIFEQVFSYSLEVDPATYRGPAVRKSNTNAAHDGTVVQCPLDVSRTEPGFVFQKLINNSQDGTSVQDLRVVYVYGQIPVVYIKQRAMARRFANENSSVELHSAAELFSEMEIQKICRMADAMGLDFGGIDVLRDQEDGRIYIVDVNKTCMGPPIALPYRDKVAAVERVAEAFGKRIGGRATDVPSKCDLELCEEGENR